MSAANEVWTPGDADEVASLLRRAATERIPLLPRGGGTHLASMPHATSEMAVLDLRRMSRVLAYDPGDLTIVVEAGTTIEVLDQVLKQQGHELALDAELPHQATIGGLLAADFPTRAGALGRVLRDQVIGTRVAGLDGQLTRSGGRVVKNVTGYDLDKLYIGSRGTLAVLVEVALRVHPRPSTTHFVAAACESFAAAHALALQWRDPVPASLDVLLRNSIDPALSSLPASLSNAPYLVLASWRGSPQVAAAHAEHASVRASECGAVVETLDGAAEISAQRFASAPRTALGCTDNSTVLALAGRPSQATANMHALESALQSAGIASTARVFSEAAGLRTRACFAESPSLAAFEALLNALATAAHHSDARLHLESASSEMHALAWSSTYRRLLPAYGGVTVMRRIKQSFDEHGLLHPGAWPMLEEEESLTTKS